MIDVLDSESSGPGSIPGQGVIALCSWAKHFTLTHSASLNPGVLMVLVNLTLGVNPVMD